MYTGNNITTVIFVIICLYMLKCLRACAYLNIHYLYISGPFIGLVGHLLLDASQFLLQITGLVLVELRQVV